MTPQQALERLQGQCSRTEYCSGQIRRKLLKWSRENVAAGKRGFSEEEIAFILNSLVLDKFVDDNRFAGAYVRDKVKFLKWGKVKIAYNLKGLGIPVETINAALAENVDLFGDEVLFKLLEGKCRQFKGEDTKERKREKLIRFALGRGFEYGDVLKAVDKVIFSIFAD